MKEIIAYEMSFDKKFEYLNDVSCIPFQEQYWDECRRKQMEWPKSDNVQINISIPSEWKTKLENLARIYSVDERHYNKEKALITWIKANKIKY